MVCLNHTDTDAVTRCRACGKPLCAKCVYSSNGADFCSVTCAKRSEESDSRSEDVIKRKAKTDSKRSLRNFIWLLILLAAAIAAWNYYDKHKEEINSKVSEGVKAVKEKSNSAIESGNKALDKESKYKRDRENMVK